MTVTPRVGWIGLGRIGAPMAERVLAAGAPLALWARRGEAARALVDRGAAWHDALEPLAAASDIVVTVVTGPHDVQSLHARLMPAARPGTLFVDLSTATPHTAEAAGALARRHGHAVLDAPVTGGVAGAQRGSLTAFVGGEPLSVERARSLLQAFCSRVVACGPSGSGYRTKLINQTLVAGVLMGLADGARQARAAGLDGAMLQEALGSGTAGGFLFDSYFARMLGLQGPVSFTLGLLLKDLRLAREQAATLAQPAPLLDAAVATVAAAVERHGADAGVQALAA